jgi:hypothetical protein
MRLLGYKINGDIVGKDILTWSENELNGNQPFVINEIIIDGYGDISSISNWYGIGVNLNKDSQYIREQINDMLLNIGFSNLDIDDKKIVSKLFLVSKLERNSVLTEEEQIQSWDELIVNSQNSRFKRWEAAKKYISYKLSEINSSDLALSTSKLCTDYINYNIITKSKDGVSGLFDYLRGEGDYEDNGYPSKTYWSQTDENVLMEILNKGNY